METLTSVRHRSRVALTAQAIRKDLKAQYPHTKFTVRSENYSGGDSIHVDYIATIDGARIKDVKSMLCKYEGGHFDGMTDMYEYRSGAGDLTTKYLFVNDDIGALMIEYKPACMQYWGLTSEDDQECKKRTNRWFYETLREYIRDEVLTPPSV